MFIKMYSDTQVLNGLAKRWFQELTDDRAEPIQALFVFKTNLIGSLNQISCNLSTPFIPVVDEFSFCQVCNIFHHDKKCGSGMQALSNSGY